MAVKAKPKQKFKFHKVKRKPSPIAIGVDLSLSSLACAAKMYDSTLDRMQGPTWTIRRWEKGIPLYDKLGEVSKAHDFIHDIMYHLNGGFIKDADDLTIGIEELPPRPMNAQRYREQAAIIGAFIGGLKRYGFKNVIPVSATAWQSIVAKDLEKSLKDLDKWDVKNWTIETYDAPKWKDLVRNSKLGLISKPKGSVAMPEQPDDRYDSTGIMEYVWEVIHAR